MAAKRRRRKESTLTPALVILNLLIFCVIALMIFFVYKFITSEESQPQERTTPVPRTIRVVTEAIIETEAEITTEETTEEPISMTKAKTTTPAPVTSPNSENDEIMNINIETDYSPEYFKNDLFIGDSIMTGLSGFGFLPNENVFAKIGLNPESILTAKIDDITAEQKIKELLPEKIYIMLGTNGLAFFSGEVMIEYLGQFIDIIKKTSQESDIIIMTIPPVTAAHDAIGNETMKDINIYNDLLKKLAVEKECELADICELLKDNNGYFSNRYAEQDGLHFLGTTYKVVLGYLQHM